MSYEKELLENFDSLIKEYDCTKEEIILLQKYLDKNLNFLKNLNKAIESNLNSKEDLKSMYEFLVGKDQGRDNV